MAQATLDKAKNINKEMSSEDATKLANRNRGGALAVLIVGYATKEMQQDQERGKKRMMYVKSITELTAEGHQEFRKELQHELTFLTESAAMAVKNGVATEDETSKGGYSINSFRVMVSCFRTISAACELGWKMEPANITWDDTLEQCRNIRKAQASAGVTVAIEGTRKLGGGRKVQTDLGKAQAMISKLTRKDKMKICQALAAELGLKFAA